MKTYQIPTGYLFVDTYSRGELETLSIGDYGKEYNIKADFLGYTRELAGVPNRPCKPLSEKWVITLSTQYGCPQACSFCDVPNIPFKGNASLCDLQTQFVSAVNRFPAVHYTDRLNVHFARMGEPVFNPAVLEFAAWLFYEKSDLQERLHLRWEVCHPVLTTSLPRWKPLEGRLQSWCAHKNHTLNGQAGLQFSINSTSDEQRDKMFAGKSLRLKEIAGIGDGLPDPLGRKYCLNFALATGYEVDGKKLASMFDPRKFMCKITPIHNNNACRSNGIETRDGYCSFTPYQAAEASLKEAGFDVIVFVPSMDEENGLVTCGNAILGGGKLNV